MNGIHKFERDMLMGENIHVRRKIRDYGFEKHWHSYYEMILYSGCEGYCYLNGERIEIKGTCIFFLTPKDFHEIKAANTEGSYSVTVSFCEQMIDKKLLFPLCSSAAVLHGAGAELSSAINELYAVYEGKSPFRDIRLFHLLNCVLASVAEKGATVSESDGSIPQPIRDAISYILTNSEKDITLEEISAAVRLSPTYFSHLFHEVTGISFKKYLITMRIEYAKRMLEERDMQILDIGYECGFNTPSQFIRAFKSITGITPTEYRSSKIKKQYPHKPAKSSL